MKKKESDDIMDITLRALEAANRKYKSPVTISQIKLQFPANFTFNRKFLRLIDTYLRKLVKSGHAESTPLTKRKYYYAASAYLNGRTISECNINPEVISTESFLIELCREAVLFYNRPLTASEIIEFGANNEKYDRLNLENAGKNLTVLAKMEKVLQAGTVTGAKNSRKLYSLDVIKVRAGEKVIHSFAQIVMEAFYEIWKQHTNECGGLPKPIVTIEISRYVKKHHPNLKLKNNVLCCSITNFARKPHPLIRKIRRSGQVKIGLVPYDVKDAELNLSDFFVSEYEKLEVLIKKACEKFGRPVSSNDLKKIISENKSFEFKTKVPFTEYLSASISNKKRLKKHKRAEKIGQACGRTYYFYGTDKEIEAASYYVSYLRAANEWKRMKAKEHLEEIESCRLPTVAAGRALLILSGAGKIAGQIKSVLDFGIFDADIMRQAELLQKEIERAIAYGLEWIKVKGIDKLNLPAEVEGINRGWLSGELLPILLPLYPAAEKIQENHELVTLLEKEIRRIPNPDFKGQFSKNPKEAARTLFEYTDALMVAAKRWGSYEAAFQAMLASAEMGYLRDSRFIIPAITSPDFDERIVAVACLAFLKDESSIEALRKCIAEDLDPKIRESAIWAYAFSTEMKDRSVMQKAAETDKNDKVRKHAEKITNGNYEDLWKI